MIRITVDVLKDPLKLDIDVNRKAKELMVTEGFGYFKSIRKAEKIVSKVQCSTTIITQNDKLKVKEIADIAEHIAEGKLHEFTFEIIED